MHRTFEELAGHEIDGLYQGALFLKAGETAAAEDLVLWTLTGAIPSFRQGLSPADATRWLEDRLVRAFLAGAPPMDSEVGPVVEADAVQSPISGEVAIDPQALFMAAERVPPRARAALWLVIFRRWRYEDASRVLEMDQASLRNLLRYRHILLTAIMRGSGDRSGTDGFET